jgi:hypothetical protein
MKRRKAKLLLFFLFVIAMFPSSAIASPLASPMPQNFCETSVDDPHCLSFFDGIGAFLSEMGTTLAVAIIAGLDMVIWAIARAALAVYDLAVNGTWLEIFRNDLLGNLSDLMPDTLRQVSLGPTGIMYIALALAGVLMTIPMALSSTNRLIKPDRVIVWGVVMSALFIFGTAGYDLMGGLEDMRISIVRQMMGSDSTTSAVENLILTPMKATTAEKGFETNNLIQLPSQFLSSYFPNIVREDVSVRVIESGWWGVINTKVESKESKTARIGGAAQSLLYGLIALGSSIVVLEFALAFVFLGVAALILMLFLVACLPLGFFEFGNVILMRIVESYVQIAAISLALALFMRVSGGLMAALPDATSPSAFVEWVLLIGALLMANSTLWGGARKALTGSFSNFSNSIRTAVGVGAAPGMLALAGAFAGERVGQVRDNVDATKKQIGKVAVSAAMGFMTGGTAGAIIGGASGLLGSGMMMPMRNSLARQDAQNAIANRGDVFINNVFSSVPQNPAVGGVVGSSAPLVTPNMPRSAQPTARSVQEADKTISPLVPSELTSRAMDATKSLSPDER